MCGDCDQEVEPLREVYLARRARIAATWAPRRRWTAEAVPPAQAMPLSVAEPTPQAAQ